MRYGHGMDTVASPHVRVSTLSVLSLEPPTPTHIRTHMGVHIHPHSTGENISSVQVESALMQFPKVMEAAVIAIPDPKWGEVPKAFVVPKPGQTITAEEVHTHKHAMRSAPCTHASALGLPCAYSNTLTALTHC